jgi:hypothetical protein
VTDSITQRRKKCRRYYWKNRKKVLARIKITGKRYYLLNKGEIDAKHRKYYYKNKEKMTERANRYYRDNTDKIHRRHKLYRNTEKGKQIESQKQARRKRELGFSLSSENIVDEPIVWHHITDLNVVAIPRDLHELYTYNDVNIHRENLFPVVEQIYPNLAYLLSNNNNGSDKEIKKEVRNYA